MTFYRQKRPTPVKPPPNGDEYLNYLGEGMEMLLQEREERMNGGVFKKQFTLGNIISTILLLGSIIYFAARVDSHISTDLTQAQTEDLIDKRISAKHEKDDYRLGLVEEAVKRNSEAIQSNSASLRELVMASKEKDSRLERKINRLLEAR